MHIREMTIKDYEAIIELLQETPGITLRNADSRESTQAYLLRNPGLSFVAIVEREIVGCVMCGHDGRRGYLQHLAVRQTNRRRGIGNKLFMSCTRGLHKIGIDKTHLFVLATNTLANDYWKNHGWQLRKDINMYSYNISAHENA